MIKKKKYYTIMKSYSALTEKNCEQITELSRTVFGENDADFIGEFIRKSPFQEENKIFLAIDDRTDTIVGFVNLTDIPLNYYGIEMKSCELSIVATEESYRGLGISGNLTDLFMDEIEKCGYCTIFIQGIPYFYRKYGFNYAIPMATSRFHFDSTSVATQSSNPIRKATVEDVPFIYNQSLKYVENHDCIHRTIGSEIIEKAITTYQSRFLKRYYFIVEANNKPAGYFYYTKEHDTPKIEDLSEMDEEKYSAITGFMRDETREGCFDVSIPFEHKFYEYLKLINKKFEINKGDYSWQVKIPDYYRFFSRIKPVLEKNLEKSSYKNKTISFKFNNFDELIEFKIDRSRIELQRLPWHLTWDCNVPPQAFVKLAFDRFTYDDLKPIIPDLSIKEEFRELFRILFPSKVHHLNHGY